MRASTTPKHDHPRPTSPPTSTGASTTSVRPTKALEFVPSSLEIELERPPVCICVIVIVAQLRAASGACRRGCGYGGRRAASASPCVSGGRKAARAPCATLLLRLLLLLRVGR
jgi:hypothetical protein